MTGPAGSALPWPWVHVQGRVGERVGPRPGAKLDAIESVGEL
jgi:hypothetical protein